MRRDILPALLLCVFTLASTTAAPTTATAAEPGKSGKPAAKPEAAKPEGAKPEASEVTTVKRPEEKKADEGKDGKKDGKKGPMKPEQRRNQERSAIEDLDDELSILKELLEIERGSDTEADTLLELSYVLWDRAEAYQIEAYDQKYEVGIAKAEQAGDKPTARRLKIEQQNLLELARAAKLDVVNHLKRIERAFPAYAKLDEVLYSMGFHLNEMERPSEAVDAYMRLVRKRPQSPFRPDAHLGIGMYYFSKNQGGDALKNYRKVTEFPESSVYGWGLYYIAWVHYNQQQWGDAIKGFIRVLDYSKNEAKGRVTFMEDASRYLVRSWAETGKPKEALAFFKSVAAGTEALLLDNLAQYYIDISAFDKSNVVLDDLIDFAKEDARMVRYLTMRLDNSYKLHDLEQVVKSTAMLSNYLRQKPDKRSGTLELLLAEIASSFHAEHERTLMVPVLETAEKVYRAYGEHFETGEHGYDMLHNHALSLYQLANLSCKDADKLAKEKNGAEKSAAARELCYQRFNDAAAGYERVIALQPNGKYAESAAHRAFIAYYRTQNVSQEVGIKSQDNILRPIALNQTEERVASACDRYIGIALKNQSREDVPEALFVGGRMYYQHNMFDKAGDRLVNLIERFPDHTLAVTAARMMMSAYALGQDGKNLIKWTNKLIDDPRFTTVSPEAVAFKAILTEIKSNEEYNKCLELRDEPEKAAECLKTYAAKFPDDRKQAARAVVGAADFYRRAKKRDAVIGMYQALARNFSDDERAAQASLEVAEIYLQSADFDAAVTAYEEFVTAYPNAPLVPVALKRATGINKSLARFEKVVANGEMFLDLCNKATSQSAKEACTPEARARVAYDVTLPYKEKGDWKAVIKASDKFLKRSESIPVHLRLAAMVNTGAAQNKLSLGDKGRKLFEDVVKEGKAIMEAGRINELDPVGREALAEATFMIGEVEFAKMQAIKGKAKDVKGAAELAAAKTQASAVAETFYGATEGLRSVLWTAAAATRRGRMQQDIAASLRAIPVPAALRTDEFKMEWDAQMAEKAKPFEEKAISLYRQALDKAAAIFAFDKYWAEARDNLKVLDSKFAEQVDLKEAMVDVVPLKWGESTKPAEVIQTLRIKLFDLSNTSSGDKIENANVEAAAKANPEMAQAWQRLAMAHHALGQHREAVVAATFGMAAAPELAKSAAMWNMVGLSRRALGEVQFSLQAFEKAAEADPTATEPLLNAAAITVRNLGFVKTVELLDEVLKRDPDNYWAKVTRAVAMRRASDDPDKIKQALASLDELAGKTDRPEAHYNRCVIAQAVLTTSKAEVKRALEACSQALKVAQAKKAPTLAELQKRVKGLDQMIQFMPDDDAPKAKQRLNTLNEKLKLDDKLEEKTIEGEEKATGETKDDKPQTRKPAEIKLEDKTEEPKKADEPKAEEPKKADEPKTEDPKKADEAPAQP